MAERIFARWNGGLEMGHKPVVFKWDGQWYVDLDPDGVPMHKSEWCETFDEAVAWLIENDPRRSTT